MISTLIAHINEVQSLFFTVQNYVNEFTRRKLSYEIIISDNMSINEHAKFLNDWQTLCRNPHIKFYYFDKIGTIPNWQNAFSKSSGDVILFSDQHVIPSYNFFDQQLPLLTNEHPVVYGSAGFLEWPYEGGESMFEYSLSTNNLRHSFADKKSDQPYEVLSSQLGCVLVKRDHFEKIGMFGKCFDKVGGYTAEEVMLPIKTWMFGKKPIFNPNAHYLHAPLPRSTEGNCREKGKSLCVAAYALGGQEYFDAVYPHWQHEVTDREFIINEATPEYEFLNKNATHRYYDVLDMWFGDHSLH